MQCMEELTIKLIQLDHDLAKRPMSDEFSDGIPEEHKS